MARWQPCQAQLHLHSKVPLATSCYSSKRHRNTERQVTTKQTVYGTHMDQDLECPGTHLFQFKCVQGPPLQNSNASSPASNVHRMEGHLNASSPASNVHRMEEHLNASSPASNVHRMEGHLNASSPASNVYRMEGHLNGESRMCHTRSFITQRK